jgi:type IV fimbrial biogenesis protein FimT
MTPERQTGVTLIELLVTISIAAILLAIAVPGFQDFFRRNRVDSAASDLMAALNLARSEAIRRGVPVSLCKSGNGTTCVQGGNNWEQGWIVFANPNNDGLRGDDEEIIRVHQQLQSAITLRPTDNYDNFLTYRSDGRVNTIGTFVICHNGQPAGARSITINVAGRARYVDNVANCNP